MIFHGRLLNVFKEVFLCIITQLLTVMAISLE